MPDLTGPRFQPDERPPWQRWCDVAFWAVAAGFLAAAVALAAVNRTPGSHDSANNLDTARNLAAGRGFQSNMVQQLFQWQPLPNPETIRPPGIPFLMAGLFWVFGIWPAIQVVVNAGVVLAAAWLLRWAIRRVGGGWFGSVAGVLMLASGNYEMHSIWSNNVLVLCTVGLLCLAAAAERGNSRPWTMVIACAVIASVGMLTKPTFVVTAVPFAAFLLLRTGGRPLVRFATFLAVLALLTSPYWIHNLVMFGKPVYSPSTASRLSTRYGNLPYGYGYTFRWDRPETVAEILEVRGYRGVIWQEGLMWLKTAAAVARLNVPLAVLTLLGLTIFRGRLAWRSQLFPLLAMLEPIFTSGYHHVELRYLWSIYPCGLYMIGLGIRDFTAWRQLQPAAARRLVPCFCILLVLGLTAGLCQAAVRWSGGFAAARQPPPAWVALVRATPPDAVVLTDDPYAVAWYAERRAVRCPGGPRGHLLRVVAAYRPAYYLHTGSRDNRRLHGPLALASGDVERIAAGPAPDRAETWEFCRLSLQASEANGRVAGVERSETPEVTDSGASLHSAPATRGREGSTMR